MIRFFRILKRAPILIVLLIILFFYMPPALGLSSETQRNTIVTAVGIDNKDDGYSMSFLCFVPQANSNYSEKYEVITTDGDTVSENLQKASIVLGRNVNLNHVESIVLAEALLDEDISHVLDFFARAPVVLSGVLVTVTNNTAKEVIEICNTLNEKTGVKIEDILRFSDDHIHGQETTVDSFYSGYYSPTSTSLLGYIEILNNEENGISGGAQQTGTQGSSGGDASMQSGSAGQSGGSSGQSQSKTLSNIGKMVLLKQGVKQSVLTLENVRGMNFAKTNSNRTLITLDNPSFEGGKKKKVVYEVVKNDTISSVEYENGIPKVKFKTRLRLDLYEAIDDEQNERETIDQYTINKDINALIEKVIKREFNNTLKIMRETQTDPLQIYEMLEKKSRKQFQNFLSTLENKEEFLSHVIFSITVESLPF